MVPRGEVGLIFASLGSRLLVAGVPVVDPGLYAAIVFRILLTTLVPPPALAWWLRRPGAPSLTPAPR